MNDAKTNHLLTITRLCVQVTGNLVEWQKWSIRVGFNYREGLVLHQVGYK